MTPRAVALAYLIAAIPSVAWLLGLLAAGHGGPLYAFSLIPPSAIAVATLLRRPHAAAEDVAEAVSR